MATSTIKRSTAITNISDSITTYDSFTQNDSRFGKTVNDELFMDLDFTISSDVPAGTALFNNLGFPKQNFLNYWIIVANVTNHYAYPLLVYSNKLGTYQTALPAGHYKGSGCVK